MGSEIRRLTSIIGGKIDNSKKNEKGMDEIDKWAEGIGQSERQFNSMRIQKRSKGKSPVAVMG